MRSYIKKLPFKKLNAFKLTTKPVLIESIQQQY